MKAVAALLAAALGAPAAGAAEAPPPPEEPLYQLRVHLLSGDDRVELRRAAADTLVCAAPCGTLLQLRPGDEFRLTGAGLAPSDDFSFRPRDGEVTLRVHPRPQGPRTTAKAIILAGVVVALASGVITDVGSVQSQHDCQTTGLCGQWNTTLTVGVLGTLAGVVTLVTGIVVLHANPPTSWETVGP